MNAMNAMKFDFFPDTSVLCFLSGHNMVKDITVVDTNYTDYALVLKHKVFHREYTQVALYGETHTFACTFTSYLKV